MYEGDVSWVCIELLRSGREAYVLYDNDETPYETFSASTLKFYVPKEELSGDETFAIVYLEGSQGPIWRAVLKETVQ